MKIINPSNEHGGLADDLVFSIKLTEDYNMILMTSSPERSSVEYSNGENTLVIMSGVGWDKKNIQDLGIEPELLYNKKSDKITKMNQIHKKLKGEYAMIGKRI